MSFSLNASSKSRPATRRESMDLLLIGSAEESKPTVDFRSGLSAGHVSSPTLPVKLCLEGVEWKSDHMRRGCISTLGADWQLWKLRAAWD